MTDGLTPPEADAPRIGDFEGQAATYTRPDGTETPAQVQAVYRPAPERAPDAKRVVLALDEETVDVAHGSDAFEVLL